MTSVIIDDEQSCHDNLRDLLSQFHPDIEIIDSAYDVHSGVNLIQEKQPKILFLDIMMPDGTGFDLLKRIEYSQFAIVFITAHNEFARTAIDFEAMAYLDKPVSSTNLARAIERAQHRLAYRDYLQQKQDIEEIMSNFQQEHLPSRLAVSNTTGIHYIPIQEIEYLTVEDGCTEIYHSNGKRVTVSANLVEYERRFARYPHLKRVHKSYLINLLSVRTYKNFGEVVLQSGQSIPISAKHQKDVKMQLNLI